MSKRTTFTTISPLPEGIPREIVIDFLHNHREMIDLNPLIIERHQIPPPPHAPEDETRCIWWSLTDKISYLPGGLVSGQIEYTAAFNDLPNGVQTHCYAPMGTDIRERWTLGGTLPGEPREPVELGLGAPREGLYLREDVELRCNFMMSSFVKKTLKKAHGDLVERLCQKAAIVCSRNPSPALPASKSNSNSRPHSESAGSYMGSGCVSENEKGDIRLSVSGSADHAHAQGLHSRPHQHQNQQPDPCKSSSGSCGYNGYRRHSAHGYQQTPAELE